MLILEARTSDYQRKPIDVFLSSLAEARGEIASASSCQAAAATAPSASRRSRNTAGSRSRRAPTAAGRSRAACPTRAIATGFVDLVLPVEDMPGRLRRIRPEPWGASTSLVSDDAAAPEGEDQTEEQRTIAQLLQQSGRPRLFRLQGEDVHAARAPPHADRADSETSADYIGTLRKQPDEVTLLFRDLLIGVTNFFRDNGGV